MSAEDTTKRNQSVKDMLKAQNRNLTKKANEEQSNTTKKPKSTNDNSKVGRPAKDEEERKSKQLCLYITPSEMEHLEKQAKDEFIKVNQLVYKLMKQKGILPK